MITDPELVARAKNNDHEAFRELLTRHGDISYKVARRYVHDEVQAREIMQEAVVLAWRNLRKFQDHTQFPSWLYAISQSAALMALRRSARARRHTPVTEDVVVVESATFIIAPVLRPDEKAEAAELRYHLDDAVRSLPAQQQEVFVLRHVDGLSTEETAEVMGITVPTVKTRLHRARVALQGYMTKYLTT